LIIFNHGPIPGLIEDLRTPFGGHLDHTHLAIRIRKEHDQIGLSADGDRIYDLGLRLGGNHLSI
jgi:hypothetical protein